MNSSQESLTSLSQEVLGPLSQETLNKTLSTIPKEIFDCFMKSNFDANVPSMEGHMEDFMELPDPKEIGDLMASIQMPIDESSHTQSSIPATENLPGSFGFAVLGPENNNNSKKCRYTFSPVTGKLYVKRDISCPFRFSTNEPLVGYKIRAMPYFCSPENRTKVVHRCFSHLDNDKDIGDKYHEHLIRAINKSAVYYDDLSNRRSVTVDYENPSIGESYSTCLYKFMCFTSCPGGPNRRLMCIVFTLEKNGMPYGRCKIDLKVCSDPSRDRTSEEQSYREAKSRLTSNKSCHSLSSTVNNREILNQSKRKIADNTDEKCLYLKISDKEEYNYLRGVQRLYHITKSMKKNHWNPTVPDMKKLLHLLSSSSSSHEESE